MGLPPVYGHGEVRAKVLAALRADHLPQSILIHGPAGVGKERLALWLAQTLLCETPRPEDGGPCDQCWSCRMARRLEHPDVHWFFPLPRPDAATPEKLRDKLEEHRAAELEARRSDPFHVPTYDRAPAYYMGMVQNLQRLAAAPPSTGRRSVFVVGDAEAMVPQESSPEAANAFLKLLEEPPANRTLIITSSNPGALLPTIRSRVLPVRVLRLAPGEVSAFLVNEKGMAAEEAERLAALSEGAIGRALRLLPTSGGAGVLQRQRETGRALLEAATSRNGAERFAAANAVAPAGARGEFTAGLEALALWLRDLMAVAAGAPEQVAYTADTAFLSSVAKRGVSPDGAASAILRVREAQELAAGNVNPQLILASLLRDMRRDLLRAE